MAKRLNDKEKKEIIAYYIECHNYRETGRKFGVSNKTVQRLVNSSDNEEISQKVTQKMEENTIDVLQEMKKRGKRKTEIIDKIFKAMDGKLENIDMFTNIKDLATAYGIIMDKELKVRELDLKERELKDKSENNQETLHRLDEVLKNIGGVI